MQSNLRHITQEKLLEIHASQNSVYWMSLALQEAGTIGESKAAGKIRKKSPCQGTENGSWEASTKNSQKIDIISIKGKIWRFCWGEKKRVEKQIPDQSTLLPWNIANVFPVWRCALSAKLNFITYPNMLNIIIKINYWFITNIKHKVFTQ